MMFFTLFMTYKNRPLYKVASKLTCVCYFVLPVNIFIDEKNNTVNMIIIDYKGIPYA